MITRIELLEDYRCFKQGNVIEPRPGLNLLVGDQGTGKSSLLRLILGFVNNEKRARETIRVSTSAPMRVQSFDAEKGNPRTQGKVETMFEVCSLYRSHGQVMRDILLSMPRYQDVESKTVYLLDEPDMGLSPRSIVQLVRLLEEVASDGHQLLVAAHNPLLIESAGIVYDMETWAWTPPADYLSRQTSEADISTRTPTP